MQTHNLIQCSPEWHAHRAQYKNASDSPAVLGESKYKTRSQLLAERHSGITPDVDAGTQRLFDEGHRFEALARPLAEKIIGEDLSPITGTEGEFGASFDGITFGGEVIWEHKSLNDDIRPVTFGDNLPLMYRIQMEHQLMVSGAERCLFSATKWDGEMPVEEIHVWYVPDMELRTRIVAAWKQFDADLAAYVPPEVIPAAVAAPIMALPALTVQVNGAITITDNLAVFGDKLQSFIGGLNTKPEDDQGFADIEAAVKVLQKAQDALEASEANALAQVASVDELRRTVKLYIDMARDTRLMLDKVVKARKEQIKAELIGQANDAYRQHIESLEAEIVPIRLIVVKPDFVGAAKNKRTITSLRDALDTALAQCKIDADAVAKGIRAKLAWYREGYMAYPQLFADFQQIIHKPMDDFKLIVTTRIDQHTAAEAAKLEAERERIRAEEETKARAVMNHEAARLEAIRQEEERQKALEAEALRRIEADERAKIEAEKPVPPLDISAPAMSEQHAAIDIKAAATASKPAEQLFKSPKRDELIAAIAFAYKVPERTASDWLVREFGQRAA